MNPDQLARENPAGLVRLFKQAERKSRRATDYLLAIACQLLHLATNGLVVSRGCTRITFEFEGYHTHAVVTLIAVTDTKGEFVLALDLLQKWKPDGEHRLGDFLEKAAEAYLDCHLPQWRENEGADGNLTVAVSQAPDGALVLDPRGHATVRTMAENPNPVPFTDMNDALEQLAGLAAIKAWIAAHLPLLREGGSLAPRAIVLAGLAGTGKHSVSKAISSATGRPLTTFTSVAAIDPAGIVLVDDLGREHLPLIRRLANPAETMPFLIALTERPWELPAGLLRAEVIEAVWNLDLPDVKGRVEIWDLAAKRLGHENPGFDNVILARASHEFTPAEIHEAYRRAARESHPKPPKEQLIFEALIQLQPLVEARKEDLLRLVHWARR